jgi:hypothetical protein
VLKWSVLPPWHDSKPNKGKVEFNASNESSWYKHKILYPGYAGMHTAFIYVLRLTVEMPTKVKYFIQDVYRKQMLCL